MDVFVYYNLHKQCLSVKALQGPERGRVLFHARAVQLSDAQFKVSQAGRARVLRERTKNVHAGVVGRLVAHELVTSEDVGKLRDVAALAGLACAVTYNPYRFSSFVEVTSFEPIHLAKTCVILGRRILTASKSSGLELSRV